MAIEVAFKLKNRLMFISRLQSCLSGPY
ncbi:hypothetical protein CCACVL1_19000 [Corchorus capsularis]|uniref:Uncharacterized protein n=1 Tax=Corchorus capsularis TaxID=210143 RepID=A0A1R3HIY4_COCAP|nr:hypothetical protein CCACVL1_19000 [Corchorus capsularis]